MEERMIEIEKRVLFQDRTIEELNQVIIDQQKRIETLERELSLIKKQITTIDPPVRKLEDEEPPPHY